MATATEEKNNFFLDDQGEKKNVIVNLQLSTWFMGLETSTHPEVSKASSFHDKFRWLPAIFSHIRTYIRLHYTYTLHLYENLLFLQAYLSQLQIIQFSNNLPSSLRSYCNNLNNYIRVKVCLLSRFKLECTRYLDWLWDLCGVCDRF